MPTTQQQEPSTVPAVQPTTAAAAPPRAQPWKVFADPNSSAFRGLIDRASDQKLYNVGDAALTQYAAENR